MRRTASAPIIRASQISRRSTVKSFLKTGSEVASRASCRSTDDPSKCFSSVRTESADAPPCSYSRPNSLGVRFSNNSPRDGERLFISAITATSSSGVSSSDFPNPRAGSNSVVFSTRASRDLTSSLDLSRWKSRISSK